MDTTFLQQAFSDSQVLTVPWSIDYFSVVVGVLTGALFACDRKLDIIGTVVLGLVTGYGGGIIRDMLLQTHGVYFTSHPDLILICIAICTFVFYFRGLFRHLDATVFFADALSVGLFALAGASKAFSLEQGFVLSVILGAITAVGGGAVRDICVGETPGIFQQSNFYAVAGLGGALLFTVLAYAGVPLVVVAGKMYGSGSSRDWAAKGPALLGIRAAFAESFERIHRSNLIGMGILPLQFQEGESAESLGLDGSELYTVAPIDFSQGLPEPRVVDVTAERADGQTTTFRATVRVDTPTEGRYYQHGGILPFVLRSLL